MKFEEAIELYIAKPIEQRDNFSNLLNSNPFKIEGDPEGDGPEEYIIIPESQIAIITIASALAQAKNHFKIFKELKSLVNPLLYREYEPIPEEAEDSDDDAWGGEGGGGGEGYYEEEEEPAPSRIPQEQEEDEEDSPLLPNHSPIDRYGSLTPGIIEKTAKSLGMIASFRKHKITCGMPTPYEDNAYLPFSDNRARGDNPFDYLRDSDSESDSDSDSDVSMSPTGEVAPTEDDGTT